MALNWDIGTIKDWKNVCQHEVKGEWCMTAATSQLLHLTMIVGINKITEKNVDKFCLRLRMYETVCGMSLYYTNDDGTHRNALPDSLIRKHIGLHTNASTTTDVQFKSYMFDLLKREAKAASRNMERKEKAAA